MEITNLNIEELVELRTKMILEGKDVSQINFLIDCKESEYLNYLFEDGATGGPSGAAGAASIGMGGGGVAYGNAAIGGMGAVVAAQPSNNAGVTTEPGYSAGGGKTGSGDIGVPYNAGGTKVFQKMPVDNRKGSNKRRKNKILAGLKSVFANRQDFTSGQGKDKPKRVMNFDNFTKDELSKVTRNKQ
jgi:hypothetical protein